MSLSHTITGQASVGGIAAYFNILRTSDDQFGHDDAHLPGKVGALTTRTDDDTCIVAMVAGHGLITGDDVDVFWTGGCRVDMDATVAGDNATLDGGYGDNLPDNLTAVVVTKGHRTAVAFHGDDVVACVIASDVRAVVSFLVAGTVRTSIEIAAGEVYVWPNASAAPDFGNYDFDEMVISCGDATLTAQVKVGLAY